MKKRILCAAACIILAAAAVLTACGNEAKDEPQPKTTVVSHTEIVEETLLVSEAVTDNQGNTQLESSVAEVTRVVEVTEIVALTQKEEESSSSAASTERSTSAVQTAQTAPTAVKAAEITSRVSGANPPQLISVSNPNPSDSMATLIIKGTTGTEYSISSDFSSDTMQPAIAGEAGFASFNFYIPADTARGEHILTVTDGSSNTLKINITVS